MRFLGMALSMGRPCRHCGVRIVDHAASPAACGAVFFAGSEVVHDLNVPRGSIYLVDGTAFAAPGAA